MFGFPLQMYVLKGTPPMFGMAVDDPERLVLSKLHVVASTMECANREVAANPPLKQTRTL